MSKRKAVRFDPAMSRDVGDGGDDELEAAYSDALKEKMPRLQHKERRFKEKHSLDSDEEDYEDEKGELDEEEEDAQEDGDVDYKEGVQITPFNMKEEMEEGHFDKNGMYHFDKDKGQIRDGWLDNIDWVAIKERNEETEVENKQGDGQMGEEEEMDDNREFDEIDAYKKMLELMKPGESVLKAIRRLGGGTKNKGSSASQRWKKPKPGASKDSNPQPEANKEGMLKLTEYADELLANGKIEIYQDTYEKLAFLIKKEEKSREEQSTSAPTESRVAPPADDLDIFADDAPSTNGEGDKAKPATTEVKDSSKSSSILDSDAESHEPHRP